MATPLLTTKLSIPAAPHSPIRRARLLARLEEGRRRKLTLVSAPAGFGKTTLLAEWVAAAHLPAAWVSLDERDNDPHRFWAYVLAALNGLQQGAEDSLAAPLETVGAADDALAELFGTVLAGIPGDFYLVLDDYHLITNPVLHRTLTYLLDHSPPEMHVTIAGREDPPLPLALLRARGQLVEVRAGELSFTPAEAAAFLQRATDLELPGDAVATLQGRTEGWVAALQLAALCLREGSDPAALVRTFGGTHRYIVDYLAEQVLQQQEAGVQEFLLATSVLDRLSGPLCDAVTGEAGSQARLEWLERANLFLVPLDHERQWYRYHQLFGRFLQTRLEQVHPGRVRELHGRAARWFERQGDDPQAFEHWVRAGEPDEAARLATERGSELLERGEVALFMAWLEELPRPLVRARPALGVYRAWALAMAGQVAESEACLNDVEQATAGDEGGAATGWEWSGHVAAIRAYFAVLHGETAQALALIQVALRELPAGALSLRSAVHNTLGGIYQILEDVEGATRAYEEAIRLARESGSPHIAVPAALNLADIHGQHGRQRLGMAAVREAVDLGATSGGQALPIAADAYASMAEIAYQLNDLEAATQHAEKALALSRRGGDADALVRSALTLAQVCRAQGNVERAQSLQREVGQMLQPRGTTRVQLGWGAEQAWALRRMRWWIEEGDCSRAAALAEERGLSPEAELNALNEAEYLLQARLYLAQGQADQACRLLARVRQSTEDAKRTMRLMETLVIQALALQACGERAGAVDTLAQALAMAEPEGTIRLFVDEGAPMAGLLREVVKAGHDDLAGYVARLLATLDADAGRPPAPRPQGLVEPLSERELEILHLIAAGKTYQEIARELIIAVSTVQYYVKSLYPKLGVHSGLEAVARARQLGLLL